MFTIRQGIGIQRHGRGIDDCHGDIPTPVFMPVGTAGTVKGVLSAILPAI